MHSIPHGHRWRRHAAIAAVSALLATTGYSTPRASADASGVEAEARTYYELALTQYEGGRFDEAIASFEAAYRLSERPSLLYNLYLVYQDAGRPEDAANALRQYLRVAPPNVENRTALESRLRVLEEELAETEQLAAGREAAERRATALQASLDHEAPNHALAWSVVGAGGALAVAGVITGLFAMSAQGDLEETCDVTRTCPPSEQELIDRSDQLAITTDVLLATGLTVAATGVVLRLVRGRDRSPPPVHTAGIACDATSCMAQAHFRF